MEPTQHRLGERAAVEGLWVGWHLDRQDQRGYLERRRHPVEQQWGLVVDLSVSGAGIVAPVSHQIAIGSMIDIEAGGFRGLVAVHRIAETDDPETRVYGVSFVDFPPAFTDFVYGWLAAGRPAGLQELWQRSR